GRRGRGQAAAAVADLTAPHSRRDRRGARTAADPEREAPRDPHQTDPGRRARREGTEARISPEPGSVGLLRGAGSAGHVGLRTELVQAQSATNATPSISIRAPASRDATPTV